MSRGNACALALADGSRYRIHAADAGAVEVVRTFAEAAGLAPSDCARADRRVWVRTVPEGYQRGQYGTRRRQGCLMCTLSAPADTDTLAAAMAYLSQAIAWDVQLRGGLLLHGALVERMLDADHCGVVLVAPSGIGKTTASRRLSPPWYASSDDRTLVVPDRWGRYWAHPIPTWSRFYSFNGAAGGTWNTQLALPLRALFFLSQSATDRVEPLAHPSVAVALVMESAGQTMNALRQSLGPDARQYLPGEWLANGRALIRRLPVWRLHLGLDGPFWEAIEEVLPNDGLRWRIGNTAIVPRGGTARCNHGLGGPARHAPAGRFAVNRAPAGSSALCVVRFEAYGQVFLKAMINRNLVGHYDHELGRWVGRRPLRYRVAACGLPRPPRYES